MKKNGGETIIETIVALTVIAMGLVMLPGAILTAARINKEVAEEEIFPDGEETVTTSGVTMSVTPADNNSKALSSTITVRVIQDGGYYYFEK